MKKYIVLGFAMLMVGCGQLNPDTGGGTGTISGIVVSRTGTPLSGVAVTATKGTVTSTTNSGTDGKYSLTNLSALTYTVTAAKATYQTSTESNVAVTSGQTTTANFTLYTVAETSGTLEVIVKNNNAAVKNAQVWISTSTANDLIVGTSDASGYVTFESIPAGAYGIFAYSIEADFLFASSEATVTVGTKQSKNISIAAQTSILLTIEVTDANDAAVNGATVIVTDEVGAIRTPLVTNTTDATGKATFIFYSAGFFKISASKGSSSGYTDGFIAQGANSTKKIKFSGGGGGNFTLTSSGLNSGEAILIKYARTEVGGQNKSIPLSWSNSPEGTAKFAISIHDPDANNFAHWLVINIPSTISSVAENASPNSGGTELKNDFGGDGYGGPAPPEATPHRYVITVYALSDSVSWASYDDFKNNVGNKIRGTALISGTYEAITWSAGMTTPAGTIYNIINAKCAGCHGSTNPSSGYDATSYNSTKAMAVGGKLGEKLATTSSMYNNLGSSPTERETNRLRFVKWINDGAPQ